MKRVISLGIVLLSLTLVGASCIRLGGGGNTKAAALGGVFKTTTAGDTWLSKAAVPSVSGKPSSIAGTNVLTMVMDPQDPRAISLGTRENGVLYSFDAGETWFQPSALGRGNTHAVAIDPKDKCTIYAGEANRIVKTTDCYRNFIEIYRDPVLDSQVMDIVIDPTNPDRVYAATSRGAIVRSDTAGRSWTSIRNFTTTVSDMALGGAGHRTLYVALLNQGIWRSSDAGGSWVDLTPGIRNVEKNSSFLLDYKAIVVAPSSLNTIYALIGHYGIVRSRDGGSSWEPLKLLTQPGAVEFYVLAVGPHTDQTLYYTTASTFYRTIDGGATWETRRLPSTRVPRALIVDPMDDKMIYMGVATIVK